MSKVVTWFSSKFGQACVVVLVLIMLWVTPPVANWFGAFVKLDEMRLPFALSYFALLFLWLIASADWLARRSRILTVVLGAVVGQISATASIFVASLLVPHGFARATSSLATEGAISVLSIDSTVAFVVGGWLFGAAAAIAMRKFQSAASRGQVLQ